ncbi:MAG: hypothetical protein QM758_19900 [Armatimonas sp.]
MKRILVTLATTAALALAATAQGPQATRAAVKAAPPATNGTMSFEAAIKKTGLKFQKDAEGDYKLEIQWKTEERSQLVFLRTKPAEFDKDNRVEKMHEVWSLCWKGDTRPEPDVLEKLLTTRFKVGAFQVEKSKEGKYYAYYRVDLPDDIRPGLLDHVVNMVAEVADDMEKDLTGGKDDL